MEYAHPPRLSPAEQAALTALTARVEAADKVFPLNEEAELAARHGGGAHWLANDGGEMTGYAFAGSDRAAQIVVDPAWRRRGVATALLERVRRGEPGVELWSFGDLGPARAFCGRAGYEPVRGLAVMEAPIPPGPSPARPGAEAPAPHGSPDRAIPGGGARNGDGIRIGTFTSDDLDDLARLNALVFATHPEQGRLTRADFLARMAEPWFDPAGLFLARSADGTLVGFHWTKAEGQDGEVYVLGVHPDWSGHGLGRRLLRAGLAHLEALGATVVRLWVELDNRPALSLYEASGFSVRRRDLRYRRKGPPGAS